MTAFYMFRSFWLTFFTKPRDHHIHEHAHESPATITIPLVVLAALAVCAGGFFGAMTWHDAFLPNEGREAIVKYSTTFAESEKEGWEIWEHAHHFELYDDALPALAALRAHGLKLGLLSNTERDLGLFVTHHGLDVDAVLTSRLHGKTKPHDSIFRALLAQLDVAPEEAVMVGDTVEDDVEGALAVGMHAVLLDREGRYPDVEGRLDDLRELPAALGLV
jgi:HAD superfamily hydrolase (TIGR01549 family)